MTNMQIPIAKCLLTDDDINSVFEPLKSGWLVQGPKVKEFESEWSKFTKSKFSIATTSCTSALYLSLHALGFGAGDEAIVPAFTWISTANVVEHLGGKVIFCDINLDDFNIDTKKIEKLITPKTKAILPVHLFGQPANMSEINLIAEKYNLFVVEDAACGFGSQINGKHVGNFGNTGCFSFHPRKSITTGEGGMITTNDELLAKKIICLRDHGAEISDRQRHLGPKPYLLSDHIYAGFNLRMTDIQAALGCAQIKRGQDIVKERVKIAENYFKDLSELSFLRLPLKIDDFTNGYQSFPCLFEPNQVYKSIAEKNIKKYNFLKMQRNKFMEELFNCGISTRPATHAVHMLSFYKQKYKINEIDMPYSMAANDLSISLPLYNGLKEDELQYIVNKIKTSYLKIQS